MTMEISEVRDDRLANDLAKGALAGVAATWLMGQATTLMYEKESERARASEKDARDGKSAYGIAAEKLARAVGRELTEDQSTQAASALHWMLGASAGAAYAVMRRRTPVAAAGNGLLFGTAFWAAVDEGANTALGLTPAPAAFPWQTHARGLVGHLVFGLSAHTALRALDTID